MKYLGCLNFSYEKLGELIGLDKKHKIIDIISQGRQRESNTFLIKIEGPTMYQVDEYSVIPWIPFDYFCERMKGVK